MYRWEDAEAEERRDLVRSGFSVWRVGDWGPPFFRFMRGDAKKLLLPSMIYV